MGQGTDIGIMVGYASNEIEDDMTFTHSMTRMVFWMAEPRAEAVHVDKDDVDVGAADHHVRVREW